MESLAHFSLVRRTCATIARELKEHGVPPTTNFICAGDDGNVTWNQEVVKTPWIAGKSNHRLLKHSVPRFLEDGKDIRGVFQAIYDAFLAHQKAYECGWFHGDISDNTVLALESEDRGILADWELVAPAAKNSEPIDRSKRPHDRTGTWDFMSIKLLSSLDAAHTVLDDLESFFWLTLHVSVRVVPVQIRAMDVNALMIDLFHNSRWNSQARSFFGGSGKQNLVMIDQDFSPYGDMAFPCNKALTTWYTTVRLALRASFTQSATSESDSRFDHDFMVGQFRTALNSSEWREEPLIGSESTTATKAKGGPTAAVRGARKRDLATMQGSDDNVAQHGEENDDENQDGDGDRDAEEDQGEADDEEGEDEEAEDMDESEGEGSEDEDEDEATNEEDEDEGADGSGEPPMKSLRLDAQGTHRSTRRTA